jgi:uncharacterized protein YndB with AHSA1/START domain
VSAHQSNEENERANGEDASYSCAVEQHLRARPAAIYRAWTIHFETWFATPGAIRMRPIEGEPFWFDVVHEGRRHPHYGRFVKLVPNEVVAMTWVSGEGGTEGAETTLRIDLVDDHSGTLVRLSHAGFSTPAAALRHGDAWPDVLAHLDAVLSNN